MKFCSKLVRDINFEPGGIQPCCNTENLAKVPVFNFKGGTFDMAAYIKHIVAAVHAMQEQDGMCAGCHDLGELAVPEGKPLATDLSICTVSINQHRHLCNCKCVYCSLWRKPAESYSVLTPIQSLHSQNALAPNCFFSWGGGEPGILKEFEETSLWILRNGYQQYVHTNALRFSQAIVTLLHGGGGINVSLDSGSKETYQRVKGVNGYELVVENLRKYLLAAADKNAVHLKYIVFDLNNDTYEINNFFQLCRRLGILQVQLSFNFLEVNTHTVSDKTLAAAAQFMRLAAKLGIKCMPFFILPEYMQKIQTKLSKSDRTETARV